MSAVFAIQTHTRLTTLIMHNFDKSCHFNYVQILQIMLTGMREKKNSVPKLP